MEEIDFDIIFVMKYYFFYLVSEWMIYCGIKIYEV